MNFISKSLPWLAVLAFLLACPIQAEESDTNWKPLVIVTFPLDNKSPSTFGHVGIVYTLFPSGLLSSERNVFGMSPGDTLQTQWLPQGRIDNVLALAASIESSKALPRHPGDAIQLKGSTTGNKLITRDCRQNIEDVRAMLRLLGGARSDLEPYLPADTLNHP
jgi:hypothetical protein